MRRLRKGIHPTIPLVILVALAITVSIGVAMWVNSMFKPGYESIIAYYPTGYDPGRGEVVVTLCNRGDSVLSIDSVYVAGQILDSMLFDMTYDTEPDGIADRIVLYPGYGIVIIVPVPHDATMIQIYTTSGNMFQFMLQRQEIPERRYYEPVYLPPGSNPPPPPPPPPGGGGGGSYVTSFSTVSAVWAVLAWTSVPTPGVVTSDVLCPSEPIGGPIFPGPISAY